MVMGALATPRGKVALLPVSHNLVSIQSHPDSSITLRFPESTLSSALLEMASSEDDWALRLFLCRGGRVSGCGESERYFIWITERAVLGGVDDHGGYQEACSSAISCIATLPPERIPISSPTEGLATPLLFVSLNLSGVLISPTGENGVVILIKFGFPCCRSSAIQPRLWFVHRVVPVWSVVIYTPYKRCLLRGTSPRS